MQEAQSPNVPNPTQGVLTRWREGWMLQAPEPSNEHWGMESALPWLQSQASADPQN